jgi:hypothetical protein
MSNFEKDQKKETVSTSQGHNVLATVCLRIAQGFIVLLMSMVRNEDDDVVGGTEERNLQMVILCKRLKNADI